MIGDVEACHRSFVIGIRCFANVRDLHFTMREMTPYHRLIYYLVIPAAIGLVMAKIGPFGTYIDLSFNERAAYWVSIFMLNWLQVDLLVRLMVRLMPEPGWPFLAPWIAGALVAALPATLEVFLLEAYLRFDSHQPDIVGLYLSVAVLTVAVTIPVGCFKRRILSDSVPMTDMPATPLFMRRIPKHLGRELLCLAMEDHYLRVHTALGSDMILCRMRDAVAELAPMEGLQVHRSYWIARSAVREIIRDGDKLVLALTNGMRVPVSRTYRPQLQTLGWLQA